MSIYAVQFEDYESSAASLLGVYSSCELATSAFDALYDGNPAFKERADCWDCICVYAVNLDGPLGVKHPLVWIKESSSAGFSPWRKVSGN